MNDFWKQMEKDAKSQLKTSPIKCNERPGCLTGEPDKCGPITIPTTTAKTTTIRTTPKNVCDPNSSIWSEWKNVNQCDDTCGSCGFVDQNRTCLTPKCRCDGPTTRVVRCAVSPCSYPRPTCCDGMTKQIFSERFRCVFPNTTRATVDLVVSCEGKWAAWESDHIFFATCKGGKRKDIRQCLPNNCYCRGPRYRDVPC